MAIIPWEIGATYTSKGMIFLVLSVETTALGELMARCLLLDDHPKFTQRIPPGTVMEVENWTSVWEEAMKIASPGEQGKVDP